MPSLPTDTGGNQENIPFDPARLSDADSTGAGASSGIGAGAGASSGIAPVRSAW
jgi:hypothetical protein